MPQEVSRILIDAGCTASIQFIPPVTKGITNLIRLKPTAAPFELRRKIEKALERVADLDESGISVNVHGGTIVLGGIVPMWWDWKQAERVAWAAPGVQKVENRLLIKPPL